MNCCAMAKFYVGLASEPDKAVAFPIERRRLLHGGTDDEIILVIYVDSFLAFCDGDAAEVLERAK